MDANEPPAASSAPPSSEPPPPPSSTVAAPTPTPTTTPSQTSSSSAPATTEVPPPSTSTSSSAPIPPQSQQTQQSQTRPPVATSRPQGPFPHFSSHIPATSSAATSTAPIQRGGMAIGVPAHHPRPHQPGQTFFNPSTTFSQPYSGLHRPDQSSLSNAQARQPAPGIQTIGMIGSISSGSQMRLSGVAGQHPRLGQPTARSASPATSQSLSAQKFQTHGLARPPMASSNTPTSGAQTPQTLDQQWMAAQGKQLQASPSSQYRPQLKQQVPQQRPQLSQQHQHSLQSTLLQQQQQQQQQKNLPLHLQQMHQQQSALPNQSQEHNQQFLPSRSQQMLPPQQGARAHLSVQQKSNIPASLQSAAQTGPISSVVAPDPESGTQILSKRSIRDLVAQIDPSEKLDPEVEDVLVEIADDFIESITAFGCSLAKHRKSTTLEAKDILLHVERNWSMSLPGFSGDEIKCYKKPVINDIHKERLAVIKKSMVATGDSGNVKNPTSTQAAANSKSHAAKPPPA
ncbi:transcription initiation factor TFIID subunit 12 [Dioscorea cayenensis subsp. rotundata]|uniref:Transcription initiation factor TFIID subunit 12 n=1 Tax=Dioscorea cayennensis subsp. rotundata TaxID=55577 RepID=A0AB40BFP7_DIOCR|nr:transcription initiation factor TFIID subunit 12 [Dioscorea cayenensis subsp. rotundata]